MGNTISMLCDRYTTNTSTSQIGFTGFIVQPFYNSVSTFIPKLKDFMDVFDENKKKWGEKTEFYAEQLKALKEEFDKKKDLELVKIKQ